MVQHIETNYFVATLYIMYPLSWKGCGKTILYRIKNGLPTKILVIYFYLLFNPKIPRMFLVTVRPTSRPALVVMERAKESASFWP